MKDNVLSAKHRHDLGKGPARRLRMNESLPAVIYAKGQQTLPIIISPKEINHILLGPLRRNSVMSLELSDESGKKVSSRLVMVKERQIHPVKRHLIHVDFVEIDPKKPVNVAVPLTLVGKSEAVTQGGKLEHVLQKIKISCLPHQIPEKIQVDIGTLGFGSTHASDIALPEGMKLVEKPRVVVLTIKKPRGAAKEEEEAAKAPQAKK